MNFLVFEQITKSFSKKSVLNEVSFYVRKGEIFGFVGRSGGGKSTLLNILTGLSRADSGKIFLDGKEVTRNTKFLKQNIGFVSQTDSLFPELTLRENCFYFGNLYSVKKDLMQTRFNKLCNILNLNSVKDKKLSVFSGGMVKRANILVSLIHFPELLILDEPTTGLDAILRDNLWSYIKKLNKSEKISVLLVTHLLDEVENNCDSVGILKKGKIVAFAPLEDYQKKYPGRNFKEVFEGIINYESI